MALLGCCTIPVEALGQYRTIRQGDLARNFASEICCENEGILCVFRAFRSGFVAEKARQSPQTQLCGAALNISAHGAILMDADTGQVLYEKNAQEKSLIASTTKIMTALVVLEQGGLDAVVTVPQAAVGIEGSSMYLTAGEELTVRQLLYGMMLSSGNDAAVALALHTDGSIEAFAQRMNDKAQALGLQHTSFANPNGLDSEENYSTAYDLAKITQAALNTPGFIEIVSAKTVQCGTHYLVNHNKLLWQYEGALGVKTGYTKKAGRILVGAAEQKGRRLISVTINAPDDWRDHKAMLDQGFSQYQETEILSPQQQVGKLPVMSGTAQSVPAVVRDGLTACLLPEEQAEITVYLPQFVYAPVKKGQEIGTAAVYLGEKRLGTLPVFAGEDCPETEQNRGKVSMQERVQKILSAMGVASRRKAEEYIRQGRVTVNGAVTSLGDTADADADDISLDGISLQKPARRVYILLNKPRGYVTTLQDEKGRKNVSMLVDCGARVYPVGRLDMDSEGLLILTNDGDFANKMLHPTHEVNKIYEVWVKNAGKTGIEKMRSPLVIDGYRIRPAQVELLWENRDSAKLRVTIHEGRNRQIRKMAAQCGMTVTRLKRVQEGRIQLGDLPVGKWRYLEENEISML